MSGASFLGQDGDPRRFEPEVARHAEGRRATPGSDRGRPLSDGQRGGSCSFAAGGHLDTMAEVRRGQLKVDFSAAFVAILWRTMSIVNIRSTPETLSFVFLAATAAPLGKPVRNIGIAANQLMMGIKFISLQEQDAGCGSSCLPRCLPSIRVRRGKTRMCAPPSVPMAKRQRRRRKDIEFAGVLPSSLPFTIDPPPALHTEYSTKQSGAILWTSSFTRH